MRLLYGFATAAPSRRLDVDRRAGGGRSGVEADDGAGRAGGRGPAGDRARGRSARGVERAARERSVRPAGLGGRRDPLAPPAHQRRRRGAGLRPRRGQRRRTSPPSSRTARPSRSRTPAVAACRRACRPAGCARSPRCRSSTSSACRPTRAATPGCSRPKATRFFTPTRSRQQLSLDGTGVRVGVISDGIKGIFATGCTTCGAAPNGPIATRRSARRGGRPKRERRADLVERRHSRARRFRPTAISKGCRPPRRVRVRRRRRRRHRDARDRPRPGAGGAVVVRQRRHRPRVQPGGQRSRRDQRHRRRRPRLLRRAVRRHERGLVEHRARAEQPGVSDPRLRHVGRQRGRRALLRRLRRLRRRRHGRCPGSSRPGTCTCFSRRPTRPTCWASDRSPTT